MFHYLKAVAALWILAAKANGAATLAKMKEIPTDDIVFGKGRLREDWRETFHDTLSCSRCNFLLNRDGPGIIIATYGHPGRAGFPPAVGGVVPDDFQV